MDPTLQLDSEQVLKLLELGLDNREKEAHRDFQSYGGQPSFLHDVYSPQSVPSDLVPGSSVGIAKIITAHLNGQNGKENGVGLKEYNGIAKDYNGIVKDKMNNRENGAFSAPNQNGDVINQNGGRYGYQNGGNFTESKGCDSASHPETDLLIKQLKEKIQDVNLISNDIKKRLDEEKKNNPGKNEQSFINGIKLQSNNPQPKLSSDAVTTGPGIDDLTDTGEIEEDKLKVLMTRLLAEKQRLIAECEEHTSHQRRQLEVSLPQTQTGRRPLISPPQGQDGRRHFVSAVNEERRHLISPPPLNEETKLLFGRKLSQTNETSSDYASSRSMTQSPDSYSHRGQESILPETAVPAFQRSMSQLTIDDSENDKMRHKVVNMPRKFSMDQNNLMSTGLKPATSGYRSNSVFGPRSVEVNGSQQALDASGQPGVDKKNPAIRKLVYSQYREMLKSYSHNGQKTNST